VQVFDHFGVLRRKIGDSLTLTGISCDEGRVFLADVDGQVHVLKVDGSFLASFEAAPGGMWFGGICARNNCLYVAFNARIRVYALKMKTGKRALPDFFSDFEETLGKKIKVG